MTIKHSLFYVYYTGANTFPIPPYAEEIISFIEMLVIVLNSLHVSAVSMPSPILKGLAMICVNLISREPQKVYPRIFKMQHR
jgi:hypothetical protein